MLFDSVLNLFLRRSQEVVFTTPPPVFEHPPPAPEEDLPDDDDPIWPSARIGVAEALWGEGYLFPGGEFETLTLAKPLGLSEAASLLLLGAGGGGPARSVAKELGPWVSGFETNAHLVTVATERAMRAGMARRVQCQLWDPAEAKFPHHYFHHGMSLEALRGAKPEPALAAVSTTLKPGGHLVLVELVADAPLDPTDPVVAAWARLDHRTPVAPSELAITRTLGRLGFDVRIVEDISRRHLKSAITGWRVAVGGMQEAKPSMRRVAIIVREAELWFARLKLIRTGKLRLVRWHAIGRGGIAPPAS